MGKVESGGLGSEELLGFTPSPIKSVTDEDVRRMLKEQRLKEQKFVQSIIDIKTDGDAPDPLGR